MTTEGGDCCSEVVGVGIGRECVDTHQQGSRRAKSNRRRLAVSRNVSNEVDSQEMHTVRMIFESMGFECWHILAMRRSNGEVMRVLSYNCSWQQYINLPSAFIEVTKQECKRAKHSRRSTFFPGIHCH